MKDRVSLYPGRVKLTPVSGQANTYDMVRADEPTQEGTPLSKATLLKDATADLFGLDANAVPDNALELLSRFHKGLGNEYVWEKRDSTGIVGYVNSPDPASYPPAVSDGYTYTPLGQLGAKVQIATGSYAGTGTYGSSNKNSLTFPFFPKAVFIIASQLAYFVERGGSLAWLGQSGAISGNNTCSFILTGKTLSWYCQQNNLGDFPTHIQCNASGLQYFYIAIG